MHIARPSRATRRCGRLTRRVPPLPWSPRRRARGRRRDDAGGARASRHAADHESRGRAAATVKPSPVSTVPLSGSVKTSSNNGPSSHRSSAGAAAVAATADGPSAAIARSNGMVATHASVSHHACGMTPAPARLWSCPASVHGPHIPVSLSLPCDQICIARCRMGAVPHYNQDWQASSPTIAPCPRTKARLPTWDISSLRMRQCCPGEEERHSLPSVASTAQQQSPGESVVATLSPCAVCIARLNVAARRCMRASSYWPPYLRPRVHR